MYMHCSPYKLLVISKHVLVVNPVGLILKHTPFIVILLQLLSLSWKCKNEWAGIWKSGMARNMKDVHPLSDTVLFHCFKSWRLSAYVSRGTACTDYHGK